MTRARNSANLASHGNLFVDITNDRTGIGSVVPGQNLHVAGTAGFHADVTFTGDLYNSTWDRSDNSLKFVDNAQIKLGTGGDLQIYHDGSFSRFQNGSSGDILIKNSASGRVLYLQSAIIQMQPPGGGDVIFDGRADGDVKLYYDGSQKFQTTAYGTNTTGTAVNDGLVVAGVATVTTMNVTGVLTYDDVTSVDSIGIVTARAGVSVTGGDLTINTASPTLNFTETNGDPDYRMFVNGGIFTLVDTTNNIDRFSVTTSRITLNDTVLVNDSILYIHDNIVHWGDDNTKIRFPAADTVSVETGGTTMVGITTRTAIYSHTGGVENRGQLSVRTNGTGDTIALAIGAHAAIPSTHASGSATTGVTTAIYVESSYAKRPEIRFHNSHNGNWHDSPGNTSHLRMVWTTPESSTTPEVVDIHPRVSGNAGGAFDGLRIRVTDNSNGLRNCLLLKHDAQYFYVNNSASLYNDSNGTGIAENLYHVGDITTRIRFPQNDKISLEVSGTTKFQTTSTGAQIDTILVLNGAAGNPGRLRLQEGGALCEIMVARNTDTSSFLYFKTEISGTTATRVVIDESGHLRPFVDSTYDLGITGTRWRNVYADTYYGNGANLTGIDTDLVSDTSPQLGGDLDTNSHHILLDDDHEVKFGANNDLRIFHANGNANFIQSYNDIDFRIHTFGATAKLRLQVNESENSVVCIPNGAVELYHNGNRQVFTIDGGMNWQDNKKAEFGNSGDLKIYHDGTNSRIHNTATGAIIIKNEVQDGDFMIQANDGGTNQNLLHFDTSDTGLASFHGEINMRGTNRIRFYHNTGNGTFQSFIGQQFINNNFNLVIDNQQNNIFYQSDRHVFRDKSGEGGEVFAEFIKDAGLELYFNGNKKLETTNVGCKITGGHGDGLQIENGGTNLASQIKLKNTTVNKEYTIGVAGNTGLYGQNSSFVFRDETANTTRLEITSSGHLMPGQNGAYDLGSSSYRWRNMYGQTLNLSSYAVMGAIVAADPGSAYYSFNHRIGSNFIVRGTTVLTSDVGGTKPSTFPAPNVQLMVYNSTNGQPITNEACARLLIATDAKQVGAQGYHGTIDFGSSDATASGSSAEFNYRCASIMCRGDGDTSSTVADGDLQFFTKQASVGLMHRFDIAPNGTLTGTDTNGIGSLSDQRLKTNIQDYTYDLNKFKQLKTRTFDWINPKFHEEGNIRGFIAQEIETVDPYWNYQFEVSKENAEEDYDLLPDGDENYTIKDHRPGKASKLNGKDAMYVSVIQQLMSKIETLETKVAALEGS